MGKIHIQVIKEFEHKTRSKTSVPSISRLPLIRSYLNAIWLWKAAGTALRLNFQTGQNTNPKGYQF